VKRGAGILVCPLVAALWAQTPAPEPQPAPLQFVCPMDPEVRSKTPGKCPICGMTLVANIPEPVEYPTTFAFTPPQIPANEPLQIEIRASNPKTGVAVKHFQIIHEKPIHPNPGPTSCWRISCRRAERRS
jgi:hypothetical protein